MMDEELITVTRRVVSCYSSISATNSTAMEVNNAVIDCLETNTDGQGEYEMLVYVRGVCMKD